MSKDKKNMNKEKQLIIYKCLVIILLLVLIGVFGKWGYGKYVEYRAGQLYDEMAEENNFPQNVTQTNSVGNDMSEDIAETETPEAETFETEELEIESTETEVAEIESLDNQVELPEIPGKNLDWNKLNNTNPDIYAWIYIPNTKVDYPILQSATDDNYYLTHNIDGSRGYPGCIYTEKINYKDFIDFITVIYGHNMKSGKMFRTLHNFEKKDFFDENRYVYIYTPDETFVYEIYAAYDADDSHILYANDFSSELGMEAYIESAKAQAQIGGYYRNDVEVNVNSKIITLSTCTNRSNRRYLVQAVRLN